MAVSDTEKNAGRLIARTFLEIAEGLETGSFGKKPRIAVTALGSEHGEQNVLAGAVRAAQSGVDVTVIGTAEHPSVRTVAVQNEEQAHAKMEELLKAGEVDGVVTMHYPFPIGVSTVGRAVAPGTGKELFLACTTGTSSADRVEGMVKNAVYGIIAAKACGIQQPTLGILNIDGARQTETVLKELAKNGYPLTFAESARADGGCVMRGNDLLTASCDVMVTDPLTGNLLMKTMSAFTTGGGYEATGFGYGPGIGPDCENLVCIVSRASGAPVIAGAIAYAAALVRSGWREIAKAEFAAAEQAGLSKLLSARKSSKQAPAEQQEVAAPPKEVVTASIAGIEIMDLEDAVRVLWAEGIYAESGMGCTGPVILVSPANLPRSEELLQQKGYRG